MNDAASRLPTLPQRISPLRRAVTAASVLIGLAGACAVGVFALAWFRPDTAAAFTALLGDGGVAVERDVAYGDGPRQRLDVYRPAGDLSDAGAVIVFLYGGSWSSGEKATYGFVGRALAARGFTTIIPDYRLYPEVQFPRFVDDAAAAYAWAERTLARRCSPALPVIVAGHSAGAHMAALLALDRSYIARMSPAVRPPDAVIGLAGPYTFEPTTWPSTRDAFASVAATPAVARPITFVSPGAPPMLLLHGLADELVALKNTRELASALTEVGSSSDVATFDGIGHIGILLALSRPFRWRAPVLDRMTEFAGLIARRGGNVQRRCDTTISD